MKTEERASFLEQGETNMVSHRPRKRTWKRTNERCPAQPVRKERSKGWCAKELASPQTAPEVRYVEPGFFLFGEGLQSFFFDTGQKTTSIEACLLSLSQLLSSVAQELFGKG